MSRLKAQGKQRIPDHVPGSMEQAATQRYFERGSQQAVDKGSWKTAALLSIGSSLLAMVCVIVLAMKSDVEVFQVAKGEGGELHVVAAAGKFTPDEDTQMAWASRWLSELTEISPSLWQRNVAIVQSKVVGTAADQVKSYLQRPDNNPAALLSEKPSYVREYSRISVNKLAEKSYMVRYELTSRPAPGAPMVKATYAATINLVSIGHKSRNDVFNNPEGLAVTGFSVSEESAPKEVN